MNGALDPTLNLDWITPGLAVGGSFPAEKAAHLSRALALRAVVDLRAEARDDAAMLRRHGLHFLSLPTEDHHAVSQAMLLRGVAFVNRHLDRDERVLIHCEHGIGRSATLALCVLVNRGMAPLDALELAKSRRGKVSPSPAQYEAWAAWLRTWRSARGASWDVPDFTAFAEIAYRHLAAGGG